ncbi:MAG TPA: protease pro-enzyme activation domain-containing protein [Candidatus Acidoferrum sp.]
MQLVLCATVCGANLLVGSAVLGQTATPAARVASAIRNDQIVTLHGNVHPMARSANDRGALPEQQPITKMHLLLQRSAAQETALQTLMQQQLDPKSPRFHAWLTPQEFGAQYGPADSDVQAVKDWLTSQGFSNLKVNNGKTLIVFDGTAGAVRNAFHTEVHRLSVRSEEHFANMQEPQIPAALAPVVAGIAGLHNFHPKSQMKHLGTIRRNATTGEVTPLFTYNFGQGLRYGISPADFKTIYNVPAAYTGAGQSIAIVAQSNINLADIAGFRSIFGLPANPPNVILNGADPGLLTATGDEGESVLDVEWSGAVAPNATIDFVISQLTDTDGLGGVDSSAIYIVDNNVAPVISYSYGSCESGLGTSGNQFYNSLWQQAAAEGITVVIAAGDNGSAGCDDPNSENSATHGIGVSGTASTPYNVAMGGTDFDQAGNQSTYWSTCTITAPATTCSTAPLSALKYIPEIPWNDSCAANATSADLTICANATATSASSPLDIVAGSGGPSTIYAKPSWQTGITGMPNDGKRDLPDVSLFSADGGNPSAPSDSFYIVCQSNQDITGDTGCSLNITTGSPCPTGTCYHNFQAVGGTSAAAPTFAGIMALVNQRTGQRQGNANPALYALAKTENFSSCKSSTLTLPNTCVFNDITTGTNSVPCTGNTANCSTTTASAIGILVSGNPAAPAFAAGTGYDLATGLGSVNVTNLVNNWAAPGLIGTGITLAPTTVTGTAGSAVTLSGTVTKSSGTTTPTGVVVFENASNVPAGNIPATNILAGDLGGPAILASGGTYSLPTSFLPAGTYTLKAHYGGDTTFAPSDSAPITVNLTKQASKVLVSFVDTNGNVVTSTPPVMYGSNYILRVDVQNASGMSCQNVTTGAVSFICPTGSVSLLDNGQPLKDFPNAQTPNASSVSNLNDRGFTEDQPIQLSVGVHPITASYTPAAGSSYTAPSPNNSNTLSVTITQATTTTAVVPSPTVISSGGSVSVTATVSSSSNSTQGPTGTVQFLNGSANFGAAVTCTPTGATGSAGASCTAQLPATVLSALPPGIIDVRPPKTPFVILAWLMAALAMFSFLLASKLATRRRAYAYAGLAFFLIAAAALAGCGASSSGGGGGGSSRSISAKYSGDTNYAGSTATAVTVTIQ